MIEQWSTIWLEVRWSQLVIFVVLLVYLISLSLEPRRIAARIRAGIGLRRRHDSIWLFYLAQILIYVIFALSLNLLLGYAGQVSVAHAAFGAIGGYTVGYLVLTDGWNFLPRPARSASAFAVIVGLLVSLPAMKLSPEYLILLTLAVSSVILGMFTTFPELGGTYGLINLPTVESSSAGRWTGRATG